jgi:hypothetical protein
MEVVFRHSSQTKQTRPSDVWRIQIFVPVNTHLVPDAVATTTLASKLILLSM